MAKENVPERRKLASMVSIRLAPDEEQQVRDAASSRGESVSNFLRQAGLAEATGVRRAQASIPMSEGSVTVGVTMDYVSDGHLVARPIGAGQLNVTNQAS